MVKISLKEITDDILLLVRNNNISESEDLSREQIHIWVKAYRHQIWREEKERKELMLKQQNIDLDEFNDGEFFSVVEVGPLELEPVASKDEIPTFTKVTKDALDSVYDKSYKSILAVHDAQGENIQYMNHIRRHYNYWRKYTFGELTAYYQPDEDGGRIYIQGLADQGNLNYVYVLYLKEEEDNDDDLDDKNEDEIQIPAWMVPGIKERILKNELPFMLNRPSDDSNNATLASVKPHGPQDDEQ